MDKIVAGEGDQEYLILITNDLNVRILSLESDEIMVISQMPLENLDQMVYQYFQQYKQCSLFCFDQGAMTAVVCFDQSDFVLLLRFGWTLQDNTDQNVFEIIDFDLDQVDKLGDAIDITCGFYNGEFQIHFVVDKSLELFDFAKDPMGDQIKSAKKKEK